MRDGWEIRTGTPEPLGATLTEDGLNVAVFSAHAEAVILCLFSEEGYETRLPLPGRTGDVWHGEVPGLGAGQLYGLRVEGPWAPEAGHRFNPEKLLIDPYARQLTAQPAVDPRLRADDPRDSAPAMPRCVVRPDPAPYPAENRPRRPWSDTVIYEAHVKGLTQTLAGVGEPGTFAGLASDAVIDHLTALGVTAIELLPVQAFSTDARLAGLGLSNYWGYQPISYFAPHPPYLGTGELAEFREMVARFHAAGIEVLLDVVYNHSGEEDAGGPALSFRGLDNASYYVLDATGGYVNHTGTGNTLDCSHPMVMRLILDSLRYWVEIMGVDGFRFDLAPVLGRGADGFSSDAPLLQAIRQDPVLREVKLIAEPWDIGPGGYRLGEFPPPFAEWNDAYRDAVRRFWRGDGGTAAELADNLLGSARLFDHDNRGPFASVNFVTAHDGFTLADLTLYAERHNLANGEENRDGHGENLSDNFGIEGPSADPAIAAARLQRRKNLLATLLLSQGTPMILAGDEIGNSQAGNNNAYAQDNPVGWVDWQGADGDLTGFLSEVLAFRRAHPILRQSRFLHGTPSEDGAQDIVWRRADGARMQPADWEDERLRHLCLELRAHPDGEETGPPLYVVLNAGGPLDITLPAAPEGQSWRRRLCTARQTGSDTSLAADSLAVYVLEPDR